MVACVNAVVPRRVDRWLLLASYAYLALPHGLFAAQWLNARAGVVYAGALLMGGVLLVRYLWREPRLCMAAAVSRWRLPLLLGLVVLLTGWAALSGIGGIGFQNSDWSAHNGVLKHLLEEDAPLVLTDAQGRPFFFVYYVAYYLPAATVGRWMGWEAANYALFGWSVLGVALAALWLVRFVGAAAHPLRLCAAALIFIVFSGLDAPGSYLREAGWPALGTHIEWWSYPLFQYSSQSALLFWVPQHAIAAWILTGVVLYLGLARLSVGILGPFAAMSLLWTPFAAVGILPFVLLAVVLGVWRDGWQAPLSASNLVVAPVIFVGSALFLLANTFSFPVEWNGRLDGDFVRRYGLFLGLEVLVFALPALWLAAARADRWRTLPWLILVLGVLAALPLVRMGFYNDLAMRGSIPALFLLMVFVTKGLLERTGRWCWMPRIALGLALVLGAQTGVSEMARSLASYRASPPNPARVYPFVRLDPNTVAQRRGDPRAFFYTYLAAE